MAKFVQLTAVSAAALLVLAGAAAAQNVTGSTTVGTDTGNPQQTNGPLIGFMTTGADMGGLSVRAYFTDGTDETALWTPLIGTAGAAVGTHWFLSNLGDTFILPWRLQNLTGKGIARVEIDGAPGNTLFDLTFGDVEGSPGSDLGRTFEVLSGQGLLDLRATYADVISVDGAPPVGDLFRRLTIEVLDPSGLPSRLTALRFLADTDNAELAGDYVACCQPWDNGRFDERNAQQSQEGLDEQTYLPYRRVTADDFYLCEGQVHRIDVVSGIMCTDSIIPKAKVIIYADCDGLPGEKIAEASAVRAPDDGLDGTVYISEAGRAFEQFRLISVEARFDKLFLRGGVYWVSLVGFSGTGDADEQLFWGTANNNIVRGRPGQFYDSDVGAWQSIEELCCGCTDFNFCVQGESCKILLDNGAPVTPGMAAGINGAPGLPSLQNGQGTANRSRAADQFVVPPCNDLVLCHVEGYVWTNCPRVGLELYVNDCHCPGEYEPVVQIETDCLIDQKQTYGSGSSAVRLYKAVFAEFLPYRLEAGKNYWLSLYGIGDGRQNARAYFARGERCDRPCGNFDPACAKVAPAGVNPWEPTDAELAFTVAVAVESMRPEDSSDDDQANNGPTCAVDLNNDGVVSIQDLFQYLSSFFGGCP
ncbi:MAG: hypothetical protein IT438_15225 [Phycisphaerales bacterium]|nr:hypothetical protein [Phycisphaerales bacterium]